MQNGRWVSSRFAILLVLTWLPVCLYAIPIQTFTMSGNCVDCAAAAGTDSHDVEISLALRDYELGNRITRQNFHSFSYSGSNLVDDFSVSLNEWEQNSLSLLFGYIPDDYSYGDAFRFTVFSADLGADSNSNLWSCTELGQQVADPGEACTNNHRLFFSMSALGNWQLGIPAKDLGTVNPASAQNTVSEPGTLFLALLGLSALRRKYRA